MTVSCVIVSYNNGPLLTDAIMSVLGQTHPVDEIIVADDASGDGSPEVIASLAREHPRIKPILRSHNLGVARNRDLAVAATTGDLITTLDGDDFFLPGKIEAELRSIHQSSALIAYSDVAIVQSRTGPTQIERIAQFARLGVDGRVQWLLGSRSHNPQSMLFDRRIHHEIGGYDHSLRTYEDWDYKIRLAAQPYGWVHSGVTGVVVRRHGSGLSATPPLQQMRDRYRVLVRNRGLAWRHAGPVFLARMSARVAMSGLKWSTVIWYWDKKHRLLTRHERH
jgi:glycosyltransferase involved in cell wall biosynthesis